MREFRSKPSMNHRSDSCPAHREEIFYDGYFNPILVYIIGICKSARNSAHSYSLAQGISLGLNFVDDRVDVSEQQLCVGDIAQHHGDVEHVKQNESSDGVDDERISDDFVLHTTIH